MKALMNTTGTIYTNFGIKASNPHLVVAGHDLEVRSVLSPMGALAVLHSTPPHARVRA